ncbi:DUF305 domain-containing protein [Sphingomonas sp. BIUV-7]|uniref:DUF305 domain-containing protein n=1 Tax=Sphingomonas natans TaxID=3063330 RepID=A0ABT8Y6D9_9SPHN|nr:DUF305 domain-containing protein [Sphingomonas sp. BIUV-7]MDO6413235.1 DUF305 domain-containing protein [Sphingomonas sp. BIUV-7]
MIDTPRPFARRLALLAALALGACSSGGEAPKVTDPVERAFLEANDKAMGAMMAAMEVKPTGDVDKDFALMMIPHHQGAIDMAQVLLKYGKNEELKALARDIVAKQAEEIALMRRIAGDAPASPAESGNMAMKHSDHSM